MSVKYPDRRLEGEVTEALVKKQITRSQEADLTPHLRHWWFLFKVEKDKRSVWMQVDLNLNDGYRIIWGASPAAAENIGYERKEVPSGLTSTAVEVATEQIARANVRYYNPNSPDDKYPRYSCQDFVIILAGRLGIPL